DHGRRMCTEGLSYVSAGRTAVRILQLVERRREMGSGASPLEVSPIGLHVRGVHQQAVDLVEQPKVLSAPAPCRHRHLLTMYAVGRVPDREVADGKPECKPKPHLVVEEERLLIERRSHRVVRTAAYEEGRHSDHVVAQKQRYQLFGWVYPLGEHLSRAPRLPRALVYFPV